MLPVKTLRLTGIERRPVRDTGKNVKLLERRPDLKLEFLVLIPGVFDDWDAETELQRPDWRDPRKAKAVSVTQAICADAVSFRAPYVAAVEEREDPQRAVVSGAR